MRRRHSSIVAKLKRALLIYSAILGGALAIDVAVDRSFGMSMISSLVMAGIAVLHLLIGPFLSVCKRRQAIILWLVGTIFVLSIALVFSLLGPSQAKEGELVFTYAVLLMALPITIIYPMAAAELLPLIGGNPIFRMLGGWVVCLILGYLQWRIICQIRDYFKKS